MTLSRDQQRAKIDAYTNRTSDDLRGLPEPTVTELQGRRAAQDAAHQAYETSQAEISRENEELARAQYLASGNAEADWQRDKARVLSDAALSRMRGGQGGSLISRAAMLV